MLFENLQTQMLIQITVLVFSLLLLLGSSSKMMNKVPCMMRYLHRSSIHPSEQAFGAEYLDPSSFFVWLARQEFYFSFGFGGSVVFRNESVSVWNESGSRGMMNWREDGRESSSSARGFCSVQRNVLSFRKLKELFEDSPVLYVWEMSLRVNVLQDYHCFNEYMISKFFEFSDN